MGFVEPNLPVVDHDVWDHQSRQERIVPMARHFAVNGFGSPDVVIVLYLVKIVLYLALGWVFVMTTPGVEGWFDVASWWRDPVVFFKFALWSMLFEVLGLGCGFGPLNMRFLPPLGSFLYWLRPGTVRLPPWRGRLPLTAGDTRTPWDVVLYAGLLAALVVALIGDLTRIQVLAVVVLLALIGLRDQTIFLAARAEVYGSVALAFLFADGAQITAAKLVLFAIWFGAAVSKINRHFPFVVAAMLSNSPVLRVGGIKRRLHRSYPEDLLPSRLSATIAHTGTAVELVAPAVMLLGGDTTVAFLASLLMIGFHLAILSSLPMGVPLEWNVFMILGVVLVFMAHPGVDWSALEWTNPAGAPGVVVLFALLVGLIIWGNAVPSKVSFLVAMRYYAGNWATSMWCFRGDALDRFDANVPKASLMPHVQLEKVYGDAQAAAVPQFMGYAFRSFHTHGRALWALVPRACGVDHEDYFVLDGEVLAGTTLGWNFGDGHLHDEQLIEALQNRCDFRPGDVRIVLLESEPFARGTQEYRLIDPATGEFERGQVDVIEMVTRQPTDSGMPVHVASGTAGDRQ